MRPPVAPYIPVPVEAARRIAEAFEKQIVIVLAFDEAHGLSHCTTYGRSPEQKEFAANFGPKLSELLGMDVAQARHFEDYRFVDEGQRAAAIEKLTSAARRADQAIFSFMATREGISCELMQDVRNALQEGIAAAGECQSTKGGR